MFGTKGKGNQCNAYVMESALIMFSQVVTFGNLEDETAVILSHKTSCIRDISKFKAGLGHNPGPSMY